MVRALQRSIFGSLAGAGFCSMRVERTPRRPSSSASVSPTGPAPTMRTWVSKPRALLPAAKRGLSRNAVCIASCDLRISASRPAAAQDLPMADLDLVLEELVTANRILAHE